MESLESDNYVINKNNLVPLLQNFSTFYKEVSDRIKLKIDIIGAGL